MQHFGWKLNEQREEQREVLAAEASAKAAAEVITSGSFEAVSDDEQSQAEKAGKGSRSKRRKQAREAKDAASDGLPQIRGVRKRNRGTKWEARNAK